MAVFFLLLLIVVLLIPVLVALERRKARRAGMSEETPVCANCFYPLGSWSTPQCPECGRDCREVGVRVGPQTSRLLLILWSYFFAVVIVGGSSAALFSYLMVRHNVSSHSQWTAIDDPEYSVTFAATSIWQRFPHRNELYGMIEFVRLPEQHRGTWRNGRWQGTEPHARITLPFETGDPPPTIDDIHAAVTAILDGDAFEDTHTLQVHAIHDMLKLIREEADSGRFFTHNFTLAPPGFTGGSGGRSAGRSAHWLASVITIALVIAFIVLAHIWIIRNCRPGWRRVIPREWELRKPDL